MFSRLTKARSLHSGTIASSGKDQADENLKVNDDSYTNGLVNVSDLLEAQAMQNQALNDLTDAKAQYVVKKTTYLQVTGR